MAPTTTQPTARAAGKAQSRQRLIEAAATAIQRHGIHGTTIGEIQKLSGLSRGMIALHFQGKENLLLAVAEDLCAGYVTHMAQAIDAAGPDPQARLLALFQADLDPKILNARDVAIWFSFRAEMHANPAFRAHIGTRSGGFSDLVQGVCAELLPATPHPQNAAQLAAHALVSLMEGLWTDFHLNPEGFDRDAALQTCIYVAARLFPGGFEAAPERA